MPARLPQDVVALGQERMLVTPFLGCMDRPLNENPLHGLCFKGDKRARPHRAFLGRQPKLEAAYDVFLKGG